MASLYRLPRSRACQNCAAAKAKCEPALGITKCKRCNKQDLECVLKDIVPRKRRREESTNGESEQVRTPRDAPSKPVRLDELERGLEYYRTALFQYFPFVLPPDVRTLATDFAAQKPFLSSVIAMLGCTEDRARQSELALQGRAYLAKHVLQNGEKSLDLLQGLLLSCHWYHFQFALKSQRSIFVHLAMGMVVDLELNKSPFARRRLMTAREADNGFEISTDALCDHTLEEKRTFLGCLYLSSVLSKASLNMDAIRFSEYAERCCEALDSSPLHSDAVLVQLCRLQHTVERIGMGRSSFTQTRRAHGLEFEFVYDAFRFRQLHDNPDVPGFVEHWDKQLTEQWDAIPEIHRSRLLLIQYGYARVCLYECCLEETLFTSPTARFAVIQRCIDAIRFLTAAFMPISEQPITLLDVPSHFYAQSNHSIFVAIQLSTVKCGNLSATVIDRELNLSWIFRVTVERIGGVVESSPVNRVPEFYRRVVPMARGIERWFAAKVRAAQGGQVEEGKGEKQGNPTEELDLDFLGQFLNLDDNLWLQDFLATDDPTAISAL